VWLESVYCVFSMYVYYQGRPKASPATQNASRKSSEGKINIRKLKRYKINVVNKGGDVYV